MTLPSNASSEPSSRTATGLISASSTSFSMVIFDNFCKKSTKSLTEFPSRPISFATSSATCSPISPNPISRIN